MKPQNAPPTDCERIGSALCRWSIGRKPEVLLLMMLATPLNVASINTARAATLFGAEPAPGLLNRALCRIENSVARGAAWLSVVRNQRRLQVQGR